MENKRHPFGMAIGSMMREVVGLLKKRITEQAEIKLSIEQIGLLLVISMQKEEVIQLWINFRLIMQSMPCGSAGSLSLYAHMYANTTDQN